MKSGKNVIVEHFRSLSFLKGNVVVKEIHPYIYPSFVLKIVEGEIEKETKNNISEVECHINTLLFSENNYEVLTGYLSVIFWGFLGNSKNDSVNFGRAFAKVINTGYIRNANGKESRDCEGVFNIEEKELKEIKAKIKTIISLVKQRKYNEAVKKAITLKGLGFSFATKLIMFIDPDNCGVLDSVIAQKLTHVEILKTSGYITNSQENTEVYQKYCLWLQDTSKKIEENLLKRAVDVERYLFYEID